VTDVAHRRSPSNNVIASARHRHRTPSVGVSNRYREYSWFPNSYTIVRLVVPWAFLCCSGVPPDSTLDSGSSVLDALEHNSESDLSSTLPDHAQVTEFCVPGATRCLRGIVARCEGSGAVETYHACPAGHVCSGTSCVPNIAYVHVVYGDPYPYLGGPSFTSSKVEDEATKQSCALNPGCCGDWPESIERYWTRRLVSDLATDERLRLTLVRPPTFESGNPPDDQCVASLKSTCGLGRYYRVLDKDKEIADLLPHGPGFYPPPLDAPGIIDQAERARAAIVAAPPGTAIQQLFQWADQIETWSEPGKPCTEDADCDRGFCLDGSCRVHVNPEVTNWSRITVLPHLYLAWISIAVFSRVEGMKCKSSRDCGVSEYECNQGVCRDDAFRCRPHHVVLMADWADSPPTRVSPCDYTYGPDKGDWAAWLRWGCACSTDSDCSPQAVCRDLKPKLRRCVPSAQSELLASGPPYGEYMKDPWVSLLTNCDLFPTGRPRDRNGEPFFATVHTIMLQDGPVPWMNGPTGQSWASSTAIVGGGSFVTPCSPEIAEYWPDDTFSCDYEAQYQGLVSRIQADVRAYTCRPEDVGLPVGSDSSTKGS
jgi:hypothetical protein